MSGLAQAAETEIHRALSGHLGSSGVSWGRPLNLLSSLTDQAAGSLLSVGLGRRREGAVVTCQWLDSVPKCCLDGFDCF